MVELEAGREEPVTEPQRGEGEEKPLVKVVRYLCKSSIGTFERFRPRDNPGGFSAKKQTYTPTVLSLSNHEANGGPRDPFPRVHVIQVILNALDGPNEVRLVELVDRVPAERAVFAPFQQNLSTLEI